MKKSSLIRVWNMMRLRHGIGLRCIQALPADQIDAHPIHAMRSSKELVVHMYWFVRAAAESVLTGTMSMDEPVAITRVATKDELVAFARASWLSADAAFAMITDEQLAATVQAPWGAMPGSMMITTIPDEYLHHRGQLYAFARQLGVTPPPNWDFEHSEHAFRPGGSAA